MPGAQCVLHASYHTTPPCWRRVFSTAHARRSRPFIGPTSLFVPTVDTMDAAEHLRRALHVYTSRTASALGIDAHAQQVYEANLETLTDPLSAGDDHDNP